MLDRYSKLLYNSEEERREAERRYREDYLREVYANDSSRKTWEEEPETIENDISWTFRWKESTRLFELAVDKFGKKLWLNSPWKSGCCERRCPLADFCEKEFRRLLQIDDEKFCYGELYLKGIDSRKLDQLEAEGHTIKIVDLTGEVIYELNEEADDGTRESVGNFVENLYFISINSFGEYANRRRKIYGSNVIPYL